MNKKTLLFILAVVITSICLRGPIASVGSLIIPMELELSVSKGALGFITTLPLIVFSVSSLIIPKIANTIGHTRILIFGMMVLTLGCYIRSVSGYAVILIGTLLVGIGISVGNVMISGIIKGNMPLQIGLATGIYLCFQNLSATAAAAFSYPLSESFDLGWRTVLASWAGPGVIAVLAWVIFGLFTKGDATNRQKIYTEDTGSIGTLWKSKLAWSITVMMGVQSVCYYVLTAWLPSILGVSDMSFVAAGFLASMFQLFALPSTFIAPLVMDRTNKIIMPAVLSGIFYILGIIIIMSSPGFPVLVIGLFILASGGGASFAWVIAIIAMVSKDSFEATRLSGMAQSLGYAMSAIAPTLAGFLYDLNGSWNPVMFMIILMSILIIISSVITGKFLGRRTGEGITL